MINLFQYMNIKTNVIFNNDIIRKMFNVVSSNIDEKIKTNYSIVLTNLITYKLELQDDGIFKSYKDILNKDINEENNYHMKSVTMYIRISF